MKKILTCFMLLTLSASALFVSADTETKDESKEIWTIDSLDHKTNQLIIGDYLYHMPLNIKVYKVKSSGADKQVVNRYALELGQNVSVEARESGVITYADSIFIIE